MHKYVHACCLWLRCENGNIDCGCCEEMNWIESQAIQSEAELVRIDPRECTWVRDLACSPPKAKLCSTPRQSILHPYVRARFVDSTYILYICCARRQGFVQLRHKPCDLVSLQLSVQSQAAQSASLWAITSSLRILHLIVNSRHVSLFKFNLSPYGWCSKPS